MVSGRRVTLAGAHQRLGGHDRRRPRPGWDIAGDDDAGRPTLLERGREAADRRGELAAGASVAGVAPRHDLNANLLFTWRRQVRTAEPAAGPPVVAARQVLRLDRWHFLDLV